MPESKSGALPLGYTPIYFSAAFEQNSSIIAYFVLGVKSKMKAFVHNFAIFFRIFQFFTI